MKEIFILFSLFFCQILMAKTDNKNVQIKPINSAEYNHNYSSYVKLKYSSFQSKGINYKYEMKVPMNYSSIATFTKRNQTNRFGTSRAQFSPRFQNLQKLDFISIVEKHKTFQLTRINTPLRPL